MSPFWKFYHNYQFFNSFTMYSNSSSYNSSYMDSIDSKLFQLLSNLVRKVLRGDGTYQHIYQTYNQLIYPTMVCNFQEKNFRDKTSQFGRWKSPLGPGTISSQHCTNFTNGGYDSWIYYNTLIKVYLKHHMWFWGRIGIQGNSMNLVVILRFQPPMVDDSK